MLRRILPEGSDREVTFADLVKRLRYRLRDADAVQLSDQELVEDLRTALEHVGWRMAEVGLTAEWLSDGTLDAPMLSTDVDLADGMANGILSLAQGIRSEDPRVIMALSDVALRLAVTLYGEPVEPENEGLPL